MAEGFQVDLDGEQVLFDGTWYSKEDLAQKIRAMVDGGDYRISRPSAALEALQSALQGLRSLTLRLPADYAEALAAEAARQGMPVGAFARELLLRAMSVSNQAASQVPDRMPIQMTAQVSPTPASAPSAFQRPPIEASNDLPTPSEAVGAIPLTPKRRLTAETPRAVTSDAGNAVENDWFKKR
jgi:hypothetical protein